MLLPLYHFSICAKTIHTAGDAVAVVSDPQSGVLIHLAAAGVEEVIVLTDLGKAHGQYIILVVICISAAGDKTGLDQLSFSVERMRYGARTALSKGKPICDFYEFAHSTGAPPERSKKEGLVSSYFSR